MENDAMHQEPKLAAPGKGLPWIEAVVLRYWIVPRYSRARTWEENLAVFLKEGKKCLEAAQKLPEARWAERVLVPRLQGLEDSSRYWSVAMTLEHLEIVSYGMLTAIESLTSGIVPTQKVDVAKVKPRGEPSPESPRVRFQRALDDIEKRVKAVSWQSHPHLRFLHPWCGKITASQWMWLMASHQGIHRRQMDAIVAAIP